MNKVCPALVSNTTLTPEIKQHIIDNRSYNPLTPHNTIAFRKLQTEIDLLKNRKQESTYQTLLEIHLHGTHKRLNVGITDISTPEFHAEIKEWSCWKSVVGQLFAYNIADPKRELRAYFFGKPPSKELIRNIMNVMKSSGIVPYTVDATIDTLVITNLESNVEERVRIDF